MSVFIVSISYIEPMIIHSHSELLGSFAYILKTTSAIYDIYHIGRATV